MSTQARADLPDDVVQHPNQEQNQVQLGAEIALEPHARFHSPQRPLSSTELPIRPTTPELHQRLERYSSHFPSLPQDARLKMPPPVEMLPFLDNPRLYCSEHPRTRGTLRRFFSFGGDDPAYSPPLRKWTRDNFLKSGLSPDGVPGRTVAERIEETMEHAAYERDKYLKLSMQYSFSGNVAIGLQILISALVTALAAVAAGRHARIGTSALGGLGTVVASYLVHARVSGEPELSRRRVQELERFIRNCESLVGDHGKDTSAVHDAVIMDLRDEFDRLLGSPNDGFSSEAAESRRSARRFRNQDDTNQHQDTKNKSPV